MNRYPDTHIAVIGIAGRFPGADSPEGFWTNLRDGVESIRVLTEEELLAAGVSKKKLSQPNFVRAWGDLPDIDRFDAGFFGINPLDAAVMDPQHRAFMEVAWEALEDAGCAAGGSDASIGVFAGSGMNAYMAYNLLSRPELVASRGEFAIRTNGNDMDFLTTRASYLLDLRGPAVSIQTACSTSLVAVHVACQSLIGGECDVALAGGVTIALPQLRGYLHREGDILSPDGHCRAFDARAAGTVFGSGVGLVVLKPLNDAVRDGNRVRAVIRGSAINNDGASKVGYTAPSVPGQAAVVAEALDVADAAADSISYVEAHGTGTSMGDPIEVAGLTTAFRAQTSRRGFCALGSLKTNVGHLDTASGVAGLIKVILALENRCLPPSLHFETPNPSIDFDESPFYVNSRLTDWTAEGMPRRAGVSSLGVGGTNAHVIVEEAPELPEGGPSRSWQLVTLSAKTGAALDAGSARLSQHIGRHKEQELSDIAYTLAVGRRAFAQRRFAVCHDTGDAQAVLEGREPERLLTSVSPASDPGVVFMFPGGGAQYVNMGLGVYREEPAFREFVDECLEILATSGSSDVGAFLLGENGLGEDEAAHILEQPSKALPALFTIEHSLARLWQSWGVEPAAMIGHSLGEYAAACLAGVFTLRDALALVTERGRLMEALSDGAMLSIPLTETEAKGHLPEGLSLAAVNAPSLCVASGPAHLIGQLEQSLSAASVQASRLHIAVAAHSPLVEPILGDMRRLLSGLELAKPRIPFVSNVTGTWITDQEARDPEYWVRHLRSTVRFSDGLKTLLRDASRALLEVGPGRTLTALARQHTKTDGTPVAALQSMRHPRDERPDMAFLLDTVGRLWLAGARIDWKRFYGRESRRRVSLPTYAFQRERYWIDPGQPHESAAGAGDAEGRKEDLADWFYVPVWKETPPVVYGSARGEAGAWLVFDDPDGVGSRLARRIGKSAVVVKAGSEFCKTSDDTYTIAPGRPEDYVRLLKDLAESARVPRRIAHLWNLMREPDVDAAFHSLVHLAQALGEHDLAHPVHIGVVSSEMQQVSCEPHVAPTKALLLGPCKVIPREFPNLTCSSIDVDLPPSQGPEEDRLLGRLLAELTSPSCDDVVAYRGRRRWILSYDPLRLEAGPSSDSLLRQGGTYLITGGLGELALAAAGPLAATWKANLVLVGREVPTTSRRMNAVRSLEARGATVLVLAADVADADAMRGVVRRTVERFGGIDGVIHAAGVLADGAIQVKTREAAAKVLAPKVKGTLVLDDVLDEVRSRDPSKPDFVALFSSITPVVGIAGQVDHAAANAFLDAFAQRQAASGGPHTVSINWAPWQEIGQAAKGVRAEGVGRRVATHPLIDECTLDPAGRRTYTRLLSADEWLLHEHRVKGGEALLAGVTYLELARAMMADGEGDRAVEIRDLYFLAPFAVPQGLTRELRATLDVTDGEHRLSIASTTRSGSRREHVRATAGYVDERPEVHDVRAIMTRCGTERLDPPISQAEHVHFGPRWQNVRRIRLGEHEALVTIELADRHREELAGYGMHPAMLDMATGGAHCLIPGHDPINDFYVPFSYGRVRVYRRFPPTILSHVRYRADGESPGGTACFDVSIMDEAGNLLVDVSDYVVRRVADPRSITHAPATADEARRDAMGTDGGLKHGIPTDAGVEALYRVLAGPRLPQVIVSPVPIRGLMAAAARGFVAPGIQADGGTAPEAPSAATVGHARPPLATPYVAPAAGLQETIAGVWQSALGIRQIGVHDDFFELGGHSLMVVGIHEELRRLGVTFPVAKAFQHSTVGSLAAYLSRQLSGAEPSAQDPADRAKRQKEAITRRGPALSGMRGE